MVWPWHVSFSEIWESKKAEKCILYYDNAAALLAVAAAKLTYNTPLLDICYGSHPLGKDIPSKLFHL